MYPPLALILPLLIFFAPLYLLLTKKTSKRLPPGNMGLPIVGQSLSFLRASRENTGEKWVQDRINKYGAVSKMNLVGTPTVFLCGQAANKFIYTCDGSTLANQQPGSIRRLCGERNIFELSGNDHKRVRGALMSFLKPEALKQCIGMMDEEIRKHFLLHWHGKEKVSAMTLMKTLTFDIMSSLIIGLEEGQRRDMPVDLFQQLIEGIFTMPINLPFTRFNCGLQATAKIRRVVLKLLNQRKQVLAMVQHDSTLPTKDLITSLLRIRNEDNSVVLPDEEIVDNVILAMIAGHDTTSNLLALMIRILAREPSIYYDVVQEQEEIAKSKASGELLTWDDLLQMKYTWRVATECLRTTPPVFCFFRKVLKDIEYEGYLIPKGWQIMWAPYVTHMDGCIYPEPTRFDPARFEKQAPTPPYCFVPFGGGPRICPGYEFAKMETLAIIHYLVTRFTWKLCCPDIDFSRDPMPTFKHGLEILIQSKISSIGN